METVRKDPLGSAWMVIAALGFTVMNLSIKAASTQFGFSSGELVFWRMLVSTLFLGIMAKAQGNTFSTPHWKTHLNRSVIGTLAMMCTFYSVMHLPLATGVTLNYTSSIWLAIFSFFILKERITLYTQAILVMGFIGVILLLNPSFQGGQEFAALVSLAGGAMSGWAYLQVRELSLLGEPGWRVVVLPLAYRPDYGRSLEHHHRLASADHLFPALSGRQRHLRHDCTIGHDPRLQGWQKIYRCLAFLPDRRFLRPVRRTAFRR